MHTKFNREFNNHRTGARGRGIKFLFTFKEWLEFWANSGHLYERGRRKGQYCMARFGDKGPYKLGNVKIVTVEQNRAEMKLTRKTRVLMRAAKLGKKHTAAHCAKISAGNMGKKMSPEAIVKMRACKLGRKNPMFGRKASGATRAKLRAAHRRRKRLGLYK